MRYAESRGSTLRGFKKLLYGRLHDDFLGQQPNVAIVVHEKPAQIRELVHAKSADGLADEVMEKLGHERLLHFGTISQELGQLADIAEMNRLAITGDIAAGGIDGSAFFGVA